MNVQKISIILISFFLLIPSLNHSTVHAADEKLIIHAPSEVYEGILFDVWVTNQNSSSVTNALVTYYDGKLNHTKYTNRNGTCQFLASEVSSDTQGTLTADKTGFTTATEPIITLDTDDSAEENDTFENTPPQAYYDNMSVDEGTRNNSLDVLQNDNDPDNDSLTITEVTQPIHGSTWTDGVVVYYSPNASFTGDDFFDYTITDGQGGFDETGVTVTVKEKNRNHPPEAYDDSFQVMMNTNTTKLDVIANDEDIDGDSLTIIDMSNASHGAVETDGAYVYYTPEPNYVGQDFFYYTISDAKNGSDSAEVTVSVYDAENNTAPVAVYDNVSVTENSYNNTLDVLVNDWDAEGDTISITNVSDPNHGSVWTDSRYVFYTPDQNFVGFDHFEYTITDNHGGFDNSGISVSVEKKSSSSPTTTLFMQSPSQVKERELFSVKITSNDLPVMNALVFFLNGSYLTSSDGIVRLVAPAVEHDTTFNIRAEKQGYQSVIQQIMISDTDINSYNPLVIHAPTTISENTSFSIAITAENKPVDNAIILFNNNSYQSNTSGIVSLVTPSLPSDQIFSITAQKEGFQTNRVLILITDNEHSIQTGRIFGRVIDASKSPVANAIVCVALQNKENICTFSTDDGLYNLYVPAGSYTLTVGKRGYHTQTQTITIQAYEAIEQTVLLTSDEQSAFTELNLQQQLIEEKITSEIKNDKVGVRVDLNDSSHFVSYFTEDISFSLNRTQTELFCQIESEDHTPGTIIVFYLGPGSLPDLDQVTITYDNCSIDEEIDLHTFFHITNTTMPAWLRLKTTEGLYLLIRVPHFSQHTITISSLLSQSSGHFQTVLLIAALGSIVGIVFLSRLFMHPVYQNYFRKKRKKQ